MRDTKQPFDLSALENDYDVVGELGAPGPGRAYFGTRKDFAAKRRDDNTGVLVEVFPVPPGDEGNALSHLASDAQILSGLSHRRLVPVIEARWVGKDILAVVTQRTTDPTLAQLLRNGETFSNPRTAAILREVNGLLEWAREQKIVHRRVTPEQVYLEPKTDRVRVTFAIAPSSGSSSRARTTTRAPSRGSPSRCSAATRTSRRATRTR
jgi:Protein tyrosine kinase.